MKLQGSEIKVERQGDMKETSFGISQGDESHILVILRDKLYSDKARAVLREYGTNALDAHMESGKGKTPINVRLPTRFNPFLTIRDFGPGLSSEDANTIYTQYGRSTKRSSNSAIGQLGLGCKSAFAYTQQFTITSWHDSKKTIYNAYIDETNKGKLANMGSLDCNAGETGVEIKIPVKSQDIEEFTTKAKSVYYYFEPRPDINTTITAPAYAISGGWWRLRNEYSVGPMAVMGSIGYPLKVESMGNVPQELKDFLQTGIEIRFKIGELAISANREDLEYTDHTRTNILKRLHQAFSELKTEITTKFKDCTTPWEARKLYAQLTARKHRSHIYGTTRSRDILGELTSKFATWTDGTRVVDLKPITISTKRTTWSSKNAIVPPANFTANYLPAGSDRVHTSSYGSSIKVGNQFTLLVNDVTTFNVKRRKVLIDTLQNDAELLILKYDGSGDLNTELKAWTEKLGIDGVTIYKLSDYDYNMVKGGTNTSNIKEKHFELVTGWHPTRSPKSKNWKTASLDIQAGEGVYMPLYRYQPDVLDWTMETFQKQLTQLKTLDSTIVLPTFYGVKRDSVAKLGAKWICIDAWLTKEILKAAKASPLLKQVPSWQSWSQHTSAGWFYRSWNKQAIERSTETFKLLIGLLGEKHEICQFYTALQSETLKFSALNNKMTNAYSLFTNTISNMPAVQAAMKPRHDFKVMVGDIHIKYPLLRSLPMVTTSEDQIKELVRYVKLIDQESKNNDN